ncbi:MAG TPA: metal ABC transporter substrate-binding protein [Bacteroidota bacterium]|nr:metal ABC transporter substrate-binding protein [Bacteroidota bacterium]
MKKYAAISLLALALFGGLQPSVARERKLKIVTTLGYLRYVAQEVGGDRVTAVALANPRQDPHYVTPTPAMNELTSDADLFIENGLSLDIWQKNVVDASGNPAIQPGNPGHLVATVNVPVKELPTEVSRAWGDIHPQGNPHVWLDPLNIRIVAANIAERLEQIDPAGTAYYKTRLEQYKAKLDAAMFGEELVRALGKSGGDVLVRKAVNNELADWLKLRGLAGKLGGWMKQAEPLEGKKVISYHKTYIYFAERFGLQITGELEEKPGIPPPPQHRDAVVEEVKREGIRVILNDNFYSREAADYVASKTGAKVLITYLDVGALPEVDTYEKLITYLVQNIVQAVR